MLEVNRILGSFWFVSLLGLANMAPFWFRGVEFLNIPVDFNKSWRGKRIFGGHKTWRGLFFAVLVAFIWFALQKILFFYSDFIKNISLFDYSRMSFCYAFFAGLGAILGDLAKSFFKRKVGIAPGKSWVPFDQIDYLLGGLLLGAFFFIPPWANIVWIFILGSGLHFIFNVLGYFLRLKKNVF